MLTSIENLNNLAIKWLLKLYELKKKKYARVPSFFPDTVQMYVKEISVWVICMQSLRISALAHPVYKEQYTYIYFKKFAHHLHKIIRDTDKAQSNVSVSIKQCQC